MPENVFQCVVICTRNRPSRMAALMRNLDSLMPKPDFIVVVDSSDSNETEITVLHSPIKDVHYLKSTPGLPHQRNVGINYLRSLLKNSTATVSFLDDDIELPLNYFESVRNRFYEFPEAACIAGYDSNLKIRESKALERLFFLRSKDDSGKVLRSGIAIPVTTPTEVTFCQWAPGHTLNVPLSKLLDIEFNEGIRMYGEDVDFLWRLSARGVIITAPELGVVHHQEPSGRDKLPDIEAFNAGARWKLCSLDPGYFRKYQVLVSTFALMAYRLAKGLGTLDVASLSRAKGLWLFFFRLALGFRVTQTDY